MTKLQLTKFALGALVLSVTASASPAADLNAGKTVYTDRAGYVLSCENGRNYPICPIAVSETGELVTANLSLGPGRGVHVRLVPMGVGYRYIGRGIWFDGLRGDATLFFGKNNAVACTVEAP